MRVRGEPNFRFFMLHAHKPGSCKFRAYFAKPWEFSLTDVLNSLYDRKIEIKLIVPDVAV